MFARRFVFVVQYNVQGLLGMFVGDALSAHGLSSLCSVIVRLETNSHFEQTPEVEEGEERLMGI